MNLVEKQPIDEIYCIEQLGFDDQNVTVFREF